MMNETTQTMDNEARQVLVYLLKQGVILAAEKPKLFAALCRHHAAIRRHLADMFLYLTLDERVGVGFVALENDAPSGETFDDETEEDSRSLITRRTLSGYETVVLLALRKHYQERETAGEQKIMIDKERLWANIAPFLSLRERESLDKGKLSGCLNRFVERKLLFRVRGDDDRFEITPLIRYVVDADFLDKLLSEYQLHAQKQ